MKKMIIKIVILLIAISSIIVNKNNLIDILPINILTVKSGSMIPTLNVNDIVIIKKERTYKIGDIVTYNYNNECLITHRIISKQEDGTYKTKGDNNNSDDPKYISNEDINGKVIFIINMELKYFIISVVSIFIIIYIIGKD